MVRSIQTAIHTTSRRRSSGGCGLNALSVLSHRLDADTYVPRQSPVKLDIIQQIRGDNRESEMKVVWCRSGNKETSPRLAPHTGGP